MSAQLNGRGSKGKLGIAESSFCDNLGIAGFNNNGLDDLECINSFVLDLSDKDFGNRKSVLPNCSSPNNLLFLQAKLVDVLNF